MLQNLISIVGDMLVIVVFILIKLSQTALDQFTGKVVNKTDDIDEFNMINDSILAIIWVFVGFHFITTIVTLLGALKKNVEDSSDNNAKPIGMDSSRIDKSFTEKE